MKIRKNTSPLMEWEQDQLFFWKQLNFDKHADLKLLNGSMRSVRLRPWQKFKAKRQGSPEGMPNINLPVRNFEHNGLYIELKRLKGGVVSPEQKWWLEELNKQGYYATVAKGHGEAINIIKNYLGIV